MEVSLLVLRTLEPELVLEAERYWLDIVFHSQPEL